MLKKFINNVSETVTAYRSIKQVTGEKGNRGIEPLLAFLDKEGLYPDFHTITGGINEPEVVVGGKKYLMFCSNNYLGLTQNKEVKQASIDAVEKYGVGPGGSRVISGNIDLIEELEGAIADLVGAEDCLTFPTGYMANIAVFQALMDPLFFDLPSPASESVIFSDEYNHGSIIDGCRLSRARKVVFKHNDIGDLKKKIKENNLPNKLIVTEGVFSLDGEIIDLPQYIRVAEENNAKIMLDDAHGVGVLGKTGGGTPEFHNCMGKVDILMGCMDKAFGGTGGYLCGNKETIRHLRIASRSSILSSSIPTMMAGAMLASVKEIKNGQQLREGIVTKAKLLGDNLRSLGFTVIGRDPIPVVALHVGSESLGIEFAKRLWDQGIFSPIIRWPAVPEGESRFRILVMAGHTNKHIEQFVEGCRKAGISLGMIS